MQALPDFHYLKLTLTLSNGTKAYHNIHLNNLYIRVRNNLLVFEGNAWQKCHLILKKVN